MIVQLADLCDDEYAPIEGFAVRVIFDAIVMFCLMRRTSEWWSNLGRHEILCTQPLGHRVSQHSSQDATRDSSCEDSNLFSL